MPSSAEPGLQSLDRLHDALHARSHALHEAGRPDDRGARSSRTCSSWPSSASSWPRGASGIARACPTSASWSRARVDGRLHVGVPEPALLAGGDEVPEHAPGPLPVPALGGLALPRLLAGRCRSAVCWSASMTYRRCGTVRGLRPRAPRRASGRYVGAVAFVGAAAGSPPGSIWTPSSRRTSSSRSSSRRRSFSAASSSTPTAPSWLGLVARYNPLTFLVGQGTPAVPRRGRASRRP